MWDYLEMSRNKGRLKKINNFEFMLFILVYQIEWSSCWNSKNISTFQIKAPSLLLNHCDRTSPFNSSNQTTTTTITQSQFNNFHKPSIQSKVNTYLQQQTEQSQHRNASESQNSKDLPPQLKPYNSQSHEEVPIVQ